jgi:hypothetical protein
MSDMAAKFDADGFYGDLARVVTVRGVKWKTVSQETGVSQSTLSRMAVGRRPDAASLAALSAWAGINPANYSPPKPQPIRFGADALAGSIREMVRADIDGDGARYTLHETAMREQLHALERELAACSMAHRRLT